MKVALDFSEKLFKNRAEAAMRLLEVLPLAKLGKEDFIIVAISTGAVPMANIISHRSDNFYDLLFTETIKAPKNDECDVAIVSETEEIVVHTNLVESFDITYDYIYGEAHRKYDINILKYLYKYRKGEKISSLKGKNVLLLDEGCETGLKVMVCAKTAINMGAKTISFAAPVIPFSFIKDLNNVVDEVYSLYEIVNFVDTNHYYENLIKIKSEEVLQIIENSHNYLPYNKHLSNL